MISEILRNMNTKGMERFAESLFLEDIFQLIRKQHEGRSAVVQFSEPSMAFANVLITTRFAHIKDSDHPL